MATIKRFECSDLTNPWNYTSGTVFGTRFVPSKIYTHENWTSVKLRLRNDPSISLEPHPKINTAASVETAPPLATVLKPSRSLTKVQFNLGARHPTRFNPPST